MSSSFLTILEGKCDAPFNEKLLNVKFAPDNFQKHCFHSIDIGNYVLATAHTGSGKTLVAEYGALHHLIKDPTKVVIYTSPIKTLSNQKYKEFTEKFAVHAVTHNIPIKVGLLTGDNKINPDGNLLIMTAEILRNALYKLDNKKPVDDEVNFVDKQIACVIIDEIHYILDKSRGRVYEETLILLDANIQRILLSATIDKATEFANWLGETKKHKISLVSTTHRIIPLNHYIYTDDTLHHILDNSSTFFSDNFDSANLAYHKGIKDKNMIKGPNLHMLNTFTKYLKDKNLLQAIIFAFNKRKCAEYAKMITHNFINHIERSKVELLFNKYMLPHKAQYEKLPQYQTLYKLLLKGIAYHHSGLVPILKEIVEIMFSEGLVKILFATETFAVGINVPCRTVVFTEQEKHSDEGKRFLNTAEYKQMSGRAGRRGLDAHGHVIILPLRDFPEKTKLRSVMLGKVPHVESQFSINYQFVLKIIQSNATNIDDFLKCSLFDKKNKAEKNEYEGQITKLIGQTEIIDTELDKLDSDTIANIKKLYDLENKNATSDFNFGISIKSSKSDIELIKQLKLLISKHQTEYNLYSTKKKLSSELDDLNFLVSKDNASTEITIQILFDHNYLNVNKGISQLTKQDITLRGILASNINECSGLILTEIIVEKLLHKLQPEEIIAVIAIFINETNLDNKMELNQIYGTDDLYSVLTTIEAITEQFIQTEKKYNISSGNYWNLYYEFVDVAYQWACGADVQQVFSLIEIDEGNFIRNMLKISNVIHDIESLCIIAQDIELLPKLESIDKLIIRDIVSMNSLYLTNK